MYFAVAAGDRRMQAVCDGLRDAGHDAELLSEPQALPQQTDVLILPVLKDAAALSAYLPFLPAHTVVYGGKLPALPGCPNRLVDYTRLDAFAEANAIPTAEGALQLAMEHLPYTIHGLPCLVIGYGRIGSRLTAMLESLGASVSVATRQVFPASLGVFRLICNTAPELVLDAAAIARLHPDCLVIDLASAPGGVDRDACAAKGQPFLWALGLPGKVAPVTSGLLLCEVILKDLMH